MTLRFPTALSMLRCLPSLLVATGAYASTIYSFNATTRAVLGSPAHQESFQLQAPAYLPLSSGGPLISFQSDDPAMLSCVSCKTPPVLAVHFLRGSDSDMIQFADLDGTTRLYSFPLNALSAGGAYRTLPGFNVNVGEVTVTSAPEPSTIALLGMGALVLLAKLRRRPVVSEVKVNAA